MKTEKKIYESPSMQVVILRARHHLLAGSPEVEGLRGEKRSYGEAQEQSWP